MNLSHMGLWGTLKIPTTALLRLLLPSFPLFGLGIKHEIHSRWKIEEHLIKGPLSKTWTENRMGPWGRKVL
jgi:hypothetical protein